MAVSGFPVEAAGRASIVDLKEQIQSRKFASIIRRDESQVDVLVDDARRGWWSC